MTLHNTRSLFFVLLFFSNACMGQNQNRNFNYRLTSLIGTDYQHCGSYSFPKDKNRFLPESEVFRISNCMTSTYQQGRAFYFKLEGPNFKSELIQGIIGLPNRAGIYQYTYQAPGCTGESCHDDFYLTRCRGDRFSDNISPKETCNWTLIESEFNPEPWNNHPEGCDFKKEYSPSDFLIYYITAKYTKSTEYYIDKSGTKADQVEILVNQIDKPVILIVSAYKRLAKS